MILQFLRFILSSLGLLFFVFVGQPLWTALHDTFATIPSQAHAPQPASALISHPVSKSSLPVSQSYGTLPIYFEPNLGQTDSQVKFIARGSGVTTLLTATEAVFSLPIADFRLPSGKQSIKPVGYGDPAGWDQRSLDLSPWNSFGRSDSGFGPTSQTPQSAIANRQSAIRMKLIGANPKAQIEGLDRLPGISNYFIGNDPKKWRTNIPHYAKVRYLDVYPGIDLVYYGNPQQVEYDFVVQPGANPSSIRLAFEGTEAIQMNRDGDLILKIAGASVRQVRPRIYQEIEGQKQNIPGSYVLNESGTVSFALGSYDLAKAIVIDPVLLYSTYLGGIGADAGYAIAVDNQGYAYLTGYAASRNFPLKNPYQGPVDTICTDPFVGTQYPCSDVFISKLSPEGTELIYSTYLGGVGEEFGAGLALDASGNVVITGGTSSTNFPTTPGALTLPPSTGISCRRGTITDAFVTRLNAAGNALLYSTYLGGACADSGSSIALDSSGNATIVGTTTSTNFPTTPGAYSTTHRGFGMQDGFVARLNSSGSALVYSTFVNEFLPSSVALDSAGNAFVAGTTSGGIPTTAGAFQSSHRGDRDAFILKLNPSGSSFVYSTYLGGSGRDDATAIALDAGGNAYITGFTFSTNFPLRNSTVPIGAYGGFVTKLNATATDVFYSTIIPGASARAIAVDPAGNAYITGFAGSQAGFQVLYPLQPDADPPFSAAFLTKLAPSGSEWLVSTFLGGRQGTLATAIALDSQNNVFLTGSTSALDFPTVNAVQPAYGGFDASKPPLSHSDVFVSKISLDTNSYVPAVLFVPIVLSSSGANGSFYTSELTLTNLSSREASLEFTYSAAIGSGGGTAQAVLAGGRQQIVPDAIAYLRQLGIPISNDGNQGGTLALRFSYPGPFSYHDLLLSARTTTRVANGNAGLSYSAVPAWNAFTGPSYLFGLRQNGTDRSNIAVQNLGRPDEGDIVLRLTVISGNPMAPQSFVLPDLQLAPGGFRQINSVLGSATPPISQGYVRVERITGRAPYYAYAVINDQVTSDGSFIAAQPVSSTAPFQATTVLTVPAVVENSSFASELVLANRTSSSKQLKLSYTAEPIDAPLDTVSVELTLFAGQQLVIPNFVQYLRTQGVSGVGPAGPNFAGPLVVSISEGNLEGVFLGTRTSTSGGGGQFGVMYPAISYPDYRDSVWVCGLQQTTEIRSNLAIVNVPFPNEDSNVYAIELFDGLTGAKVNTLTGIRVKAREWIQFNRILAERAPGVIQGYARVSRSEGGNQFIAYGVVNDGATPGERTGDGAFISSSP
jgi:Beta-propeller repeat